MTTDVVAQYGALSDTGICREDEFGTAKDPSTFLPMTGNDLQLDPGLFSPKVMFGHRDINSFPLYGQYKNAGSLAAPVFPTNGALLIPGAIGPDAQPGHGVTGSTPTAATTLAAAITVNTVEFSLTSASGYAVGDIMQVDANSPTTPTTTECRKIATLSGTTGTVDVAWAYAHASGVASHVVVAPFTHDIQQANVLSSFTVEKCLGGPEGESLQFAGTRVNKLSISATTTDAEASMTADLVAQSVAVLDSPNVVSVIDEAPFVFSEGTVGMFGDTVAQATSFTMDIDNALMKTYTFNGSHNLQFLTPVTLHVSGKVDVVWDSFDDADWGYFDKMVDGTEGTLTFTLEHPESEGSIALTCTNMVLKTVPDTLKMDDIITSTLNYEGFLNFTSSNTITAVIVNASYLPL